MANIKLWKGSERVYNKTVGAGLGTVNKVLDSVINTAVGERITSGILNKGWRALLFANRAGLIPKILGGSPPSRVYTGSELTSSDLAHSLADDVHFEQINDRRILVGRDLTHGHNFKNMQTYGINDPTAETMIKGNQILIINPCVVDSNGNPDVVILQTRPKELEHQPQSSWSDIKSIGRNTPFLHYTGSSVELHFNISWYMPGTPGGNIPDNLGGGKFNPYWVLNQCRRLEAWTMANGYAQAPPVLMIRWGSSDLYQDFLWVLKSATYKLSDFHDRLVDKASTFTGEYSIDKGVNKYVDQGLVPYSATQELIFQRVAGINLWYNDIMPWRELSNESTLQQMEQEKAQAEAEALQAGANRENTTATFNSKPSVQTPDISPKGTIGNTSKL